MRLLLAAAAASVALLAPATARSLPIPAYADAVAYASGRVLWTEPGVESATLVREAPVAGGPSNVIALVSISAGEDVRPALAATAGGFLLTVRERGADT